MIPNVFPPFLGWFFIAMASVGAVLFWTPKKLPSRAPRSTIDGGFWPERVEFSLLLRIRSADERLLAAAAPESPFQSMLMRILGPLVLALVGIVFVTKPAWSVATFVIFSLMISIGMAVNSLLGYRSSVRRMALMERRSLTDALPAWIIAIVC